MEIAVSEAESASKLFAFFAKCFSCPREGFYADIKSDRVHKELLVLEKSLPFDIRLWFPTPTLSQEEFESEYVSSFDIGFGPSLPCPLYEGVYRGEEELPREEVWDELFRFYGHFGIRLNDKERDFPDHLTTEMEFMAYLAKKEADATRQLKDTNPYRLAQRDFLERHLCRWVSKLDKKIQDNIKEPFYKATSSLLVEFLDKYLAHLNNSLGGRGL